MGVTNVPQLRSSWEKIFANWCDLNENILEWGSEIVEIPYISCEDGKQHRYISDFVFTCKNRQGRIEKWLIEVKPKSQIPQLNENGQIIFPELNKKKKLIKINNEITCTDNHKFLVINKEDKNICTEDNLETLGYWVEAKQLNPEKHLLIKRY